MFQAILLIPLTIAVISSVYMMSNVDVSQSNKHYLRRADSSRAMTINAKAIRSNYLNMKGLSNTDIFIQSHEQAHSLPEEALSSKSQDELNVMVLGDFGYVDHTSVHPEQEILSDFILQRGKSLSPSSDFFISVGDNFYPEGVKSFKDHRVEVLFEDTLHMSELNLPWYAVLGNHDLMGNLKATYALEQTFPLWKQTKAYYSRVFNIGESKSKAGFIFLNSGDMVCRDPEGRECYKKTKKNVHLDQIEPQLNWLEETLTAMNADEDLLWKVVVVHNALFSAGQKHGDNEDLKELVLPILKKYKVDVVLSGHDHSVQYLKADLSEESDLSFAANNEDQPDHCSLKEYFAEEQMDSSRDIENELDSFSEEVEDFEEELISLPVQQEDAMRSSTVQQGETLHQFVLGNGGIKHEKICPGRQMKSEGKLQYGNSVSGIGELKITEDKLSVGLVTVQGDILYTLNIARN